MPAPTVSEIRAARRLTQPEDAIASALAEAEQLVVDHAGPEYDGIDPLVATWRVTSRPVPAVHFPRPGPCRGQPAGERRSGKTRCGLKRRATNCGRPTTLVVGGADCPFPSRV